MYVLAPKTKRPILPPIPDGASSILVHDHTHTAYRYLISRKGKITHRIAFPCCAEGCMDRVVHAQLGCPGVLKLHVDDWPVDYAFEVQPISVKWLISIEDWLKEHKEKVCTFRPLMIDGKILLRLGAADEFLPSDIPNMGAYVDHLPMGLIDGPVPFRPQDVAQYVLDILDNKPHSLPPPPEFEWCGSGSWRHHVKPEHGKTYITHVPFGYAESDMPAPNSGTWAESKYEVGYGGLIRDIPQWSVTVGDQVYTDPEVYVKAWIRFKMRELDLIKFHDDEYKRKRDVFIRSIWVNKKFTNAYGDMKREYLDEKKEMKRARAVREYGAEYADKLLQLPILEFGPDFEEEEEEDDMRKAYDSDDESDEDEVMTKRVKVDDAEFTLRNLILRHRQT